MGKTGGFLAVKEVRLPLTKKMGFHASQHYLFLKYVVI